MSDQRVKVEVCKRTHQVILTYNDGTIKLLPRSELQYAYVGESVVHGCREDLIKYKELGVDVVTMGSSYVKSYTQFQLLMELFTDTLPELQLLYNLTVRRFTEMYSVFDSVSLIVQHHTKWPNFIQDFQWQVTELTINKYFLIARYRHLLKHLSPVLQDDEWNSIIVLILTQTPLVVNREFSTLWVTSYAYKHQVALTYSQVYTLSKHQLLCDCKWLRCKLHYHPAVFTFPSLDYAVTADICYVAHIHQTCQRLLSYTIPTCLFQKHIAVFMF